MVLNRALLVLLVAAGCNSSLFDANGKPDGGAGGDDSGVPATCPTPCLADAAADFDGTPNGATGHWRYLDDKRDRTWTAMTGDATAVTGAGMNKITTCAKQPDAPACAGLPGALLVTSTGATSTADPAIELAVTQNGNVQLAFHVRVPAGEPEQIVRLYRNSREDVLLTAHALPNVTLDKTVTVDALAGDRFLLAIAPMANGAAGVGVHLFASPSGAVFPQTCQTAYSFEAKATTTTVADLCHDNTLTYYDYTTTPPDPVLLGPGPFPELGMAADIAVNKYYQAKSILDKPGDTTVQFWTKIDVMPPTGNGAWVWSDQDLDAGGGLGAVIYDDGPGPRLGLSSCTDPTALTFVTATANYPSETAWHFIRIVHTAGVVSLCIDGAKKAMMNVPAGKLASTYSPRLARNVVWTPSGAFMDGHLDDVRVFNAALPCE